MGPELDDPGTPDLELADVTVPFGGLTALSDVSSRSHPARCTA